MADEKPFYIRQLPKEAQDWLKDKAYKSFIADGDKEEVAQKKAEDFLDEKVYVAEELYGKDFLKDVGKTEEPKYEVVNDKSIDAIKDNFTPPGAKSKKRKIRAKDDPNLVWDNEDLARRAIITPLLYGDFKERPEDMKEYYKELMKLPIDQLVKHKDTVGSWEFVPEDEDEYATPNNWKWRDLYNNDSPYGNDLEDAIDEWEKEDVKDDFDEDELYDQMESMGDLPSDMQLHKALKKADTNDNGKIEKDEMADFQKSLDDYAAKNKRGRDDIPVTTRR